MRARFRSWWKSIRSGLHWLWQKIQQHPVVTTIIIVVGIAIFITAAYLLNWEWVGFKGGFSKVTTTTASTGVTMTATEKSPAKTLWDWLQLLIVPIMLAIGGFWLNQLQKSREERATEQRDKTEREIAADNQREAALQEYINKMTELLLKENLRKAEPEGEVGKIARVRTLTVLSRLDGKRKESVLKFLYESGLIIFGDNLIIDISGADLSGIDLAEANLNRAYLARTNLAGANLAGARLKGAYLPFANLTGANLSRTYLAEADLSAADLSEADLTEAYLLKANLMSIHITDRQLEKAKSLKGATMPDGSIHP